MVWMLLIPLLVFGQVIKVDENTMRKLGIRTQVVKVEDQKLEVRLPAVLRANPTLSVEIYPPIEGIVKRLHVKEGDRVSKGQLLAEIYSPKIAEINAQIRMAQVRLKNAEEALKREELLYKEEVIPYARYFSAKVEHERALSEYKALLESRSSLGEVRGDNLLVRSPKGGIVVEQKAVLGSSVGLQSPLLKIQDFSTLWAYAYAEPGFQPESEGFIEYENRIYPMKLEWISPRLEPQTGKQIIRFSVENRDGKLKDGIRVNVVLRKKGMRGVWLPSQAVQRMREDVVFVRNKEGFVAKSVRVLFREDERVLVQGLSDGEEVAVSGVIFLKAQLGK
ncbi:MAG: efflux RND transporter periplasmic adaptor subunit [Aquificaceae bacterium]|nr:efflux RND transporter periplasmic adaptor subunit [Aquificaceae bacterium]MDW8423158.1 efflux RND transporter periplasmic adaptor subunit [Aquificaceae bacterium]